ncbi:MAG: DUF2164 family protein [Candidatus Pacebacteria bacterium]|nr:DUF2164 family protein [Candidatus Paceibacterota bacterium]
MPTKKNRFNFVSDEVKQKHIQNIIGFFKSERDEEIGVIAAEQILDFFIENIGEDIYRKAIKDSQKIIKEKLEDMGIEIESLSIK